jgi:hypothetical protein
MRLPKNPVFDRQPHFKKCRFEQKNRSKVQNKKKVGKKVYQVKRDGRKDKSSDLHQVMKSRLMC